MKKYNRIAKIMAFLLVTTAVCFAARPAFAKAGGHLWFYSQDPGTLNPPDLLPNPQDYDPNYVESDPDAWLTESIGILAGDWETPFSMWLGCAQFESLGTKLVISVNDAAAAAIDDMTVEGLTVGPWNTDEGDFPLPPHGIPNAADYYGFAEVNLGDLHSPPGSPYKIEINIDIDLDGSPDLSEAKIHFDAYGLTATGGQIFSPFSHDAFVIPEPATILATTASILALGLYAYKRRK